jgi:TRAP-type C4-dicarboxylate transport system permease small subunit
MRAKVDKVLNIMLVALMSVMVINVLWQVFSRYILGTPSSFTDELARFLLIWVGILGASYVSGKNMHIAINLTSSRLSPKKQKILATVNSLIIIGFVLATMVVGGCYLVYMTFILDQNSPALQIPLALVYLVLPVSGLLITYYKLSDLSNSK